MSDTPNVIALTQDNFEAEVLNSPVPVVVDFWAPWCGPCQVMNRVVAELAAEFDGLVRVGKLNIDEWEILARQYHIEAIPTLLIFDRGEVRDRISGLMYKPALFDRINKLVEPVSIADKAA